MIDDYSLIGYSKNERPDFEVFNFDPNMASFADWQKLGIKEKTIHTIQNYLSKGGKFYKAEDINKIYGMPTKDARRLIPYIKISKPRSTSGEKLNYEEKSLSNSSNFIHRVDINLADTNASISLPGIANRLAARIIKFRDKLGGFYSVEQVREMYNLPD